MTETSFRAGEQRAILSSSGGERPWCSGALWLIGSSGEWFDSALRLLRSVWRSIESHTWWCRAFFFFDCVVTWFNGNALPPSDPGFWREYEYFISGLSFPRLFLTRVRWRVFGKLALIHRCRLNHNTKTRTKIYLFNLLRTRALATSKQFLFLRIYNTFYDLQLMTWTNTFVDIHTSHSGIRVY